MKFTEAFKLMKEGKKVKLPSWGGYWKWDDEKETIIMHTKDGRELDIRETEVVEYTTMNICSDEWIEADEENTPVLGGVATFNFGEAIKYLKRGFKVARKGWNGKGMFLFLVKPNGLKVKARVDELLSATVHESISMRTADGSIVIGWLASQTDMLAEDWMFVE